MDDLSLYVCLFSNGHIKVGRSIDPANRIKQHADRVACMGVAVVEKSIFVCLDDDEAREQELINQCVTHCEQRFQLEWFGGLDFSRVCDWARAAAQRDEWRSAPAVNDDMPDFRGMLRMLKRAGYGQVYVAERCGIKQSSVSDIASGVTKEPSYRVGRALINLYREIVVPLSQRASSLPTP